MDSYTKKLLLDKADLICKEVESIDGINICEHDDFAILDDGTIDIVFIAFPATVVKRGVLTKDIRNYSRNYQDEFEYKTFVKSLRGLRTKILSAVERIGRKDEDVTIPSIDIYLPERLSSTDLRRKLKDLRNMPFDVYDQYHIGMSIAIGLRSY